MGRDERDHQADAALLDAFRAGDRRASEQLFDRHFDAIYDFFARKIRGDVSDLVQRTFVACLEARGRFRGDSSFRTFLFAIARHELYGYYRAKKRNAQLDFGVSSVHDLGPGPSTLARSRTQREAILEGLRSLPLELQIALELRFWEGLSGPELAEVLDLPEGTVRSRLRRALETLRDRLAIDPQSRSLELPPAGPSDAELEAWAVRLGSEPLG